MRLHNTFRSRILKILSEAPHRGDYGVPAVLHDLPVNKADLCVAVSLFKLEREFRRETNRRDGWFFVTVKVISTNSKCSTSSVRRSLARLELMGLIKYRVGSWAYRRATQIRFLIDNFYFADETIESVQNEDIQKQWQLNKGNNKDQ